MIFGTLLGSLGSFGVYVYFMRKGSFEGTEDVKYQMFWEDDA